MFMEDEITEGDIIRIKENLDNVFFEWPEGVDPNYLTVSKIVDGYNGQYKLIKIEEHYLNSQGVVSDLIMMKYTEKDPNATRQKNIDYILSKNS